MGIFLLIRTLPLLRSELLLILLKKLDVNCKKHFHFTTAVLPRFYERERSCLDGQVLH